MGRDARDAAHLQQQVQQLQQQLQGKERLLVEANDANRQAQVCLTSSGLHMKPRCIRLERQPLCT